MKKHLLLFLCCLFMIFSSTAAQALTIQYDGITTEYTGSIYKLVVNGKTPNLPLAPIIFNDRALVPVREIFEALGAKVSFESKTNCVNISYYDNTISMYINKNIAYVNGHKTLIPDGMTPKLINEYGKAAKTMVPVRFISESLNLDVDFHDNTIYVSNGDEEALPTQTAVAVTTVSPTSKPVASSVSTVVNSLSYKVSDNNLIVTVNTSGPAPKTSAFTLSNPERVVVDIPNGKLNTKKITYDINELGITAIRLGENEERARIVFDVSKANSPKISISGNVITITVAGVSQAIIPTATPTPSTIPAASTDKLIVLDAGHGGSDPGAIGILDGETVNEKDLTLSIVKKTYNILKGKGYNVKLTRSSDTYPTLTERAKLANDSNAALFVSVHINSSTNDTASGTEVFYADLNNDSSYGVKSSTLAKNLYNNLIKNLSSKERGVKSSNHLVTRTSLMPAALVEVGFISNTEELRKMTSDSYQQKAAEAIANGIIQTIGSVNIPENRDALQVQREKDIAEWEKTR